MFNMANANVTHLSSQLRGKEKARKKLLISCKNVRDLIVRRDILQENVTIFHLFVYEMMVNTDVFRPHMESRVRCKCNGTLIIDKKCCRIGKGKVDIV